jgi:hypothetical protein
MYAVSPQPLRVNHDVCDESELKTMLTVKGMVLEGNVVVTWLGAGEEVLEWVYTEMTSEGFENDDTRWH